MKKLLFLLLIIVAISTSCKKGASDGTATPITPIAGSITGKWLLVSGSGGISGGPIAVTDHVTTFTFNADSSYTISPGQRSGKFHISMVKSILDNQQHPYLTFSDSAYPGSLVSVKNDTLTLADNYTDGYAYIYVKVK